MLETVELYTREAVQFVFGSLKQQLTLKFDEK